MSRPASSHISDRSKRMFSGGTASPLICWRKANDGRLEVDPVACNMFQIVAYFVVSWGLCSFRNTTRPSRPSIAQPPRRRPCRGRSGAAVDWPSATAWTTVSDLGQPRSTGSVLWTTVLRLLIFTGSEGRFVTCLFICFYLKLHAHTISNEETWKQLQAITHTWEWNAKAKMALTGDNVRNKINNDQLKLVRERHKSRQVRVSNKTSKPSGTVEVIRFSW